MVQPGDDHIVSPLPSAIASASGTPVLLPVTVKMPRSFATDEPYPPELRSSSVVSPGATSAVSPSVPAIEDPPNSNALFPVCIPSLQEPAIAPAPLAVSLPPASPQPSRSVSFIGPDSRYGHNTDGGGRQSRRILARSTPLAQIAESSSSTVPREAAPLQQKREVDLVRAAAYVAEYERLHPEDLVVQAARATKMAALLAYCHQRPRVAAPAKPVASASLSFGRFAALTDWSDSDDPPSSSSVSCQPSARLSRRRIRRVATQLPVNDTLAESDRALVNTAIAQSQLDCADQRVSDIARECDAFDTRRGGEFEFTERAALVAGYDHSTLVALAARTSVRLPSSDLAPIPSTKCKEIPLRAALWDDDQERLVAATALEISKSQGIGCLSDISYHEVDIPHDAAIVDAHVLYKEKDDSRFTCRIAARGDKLPPDPNTLTHASVPSDGDKMFSLAAMQAQFEGRGESLNIRDFDVTGAFFFSW